jgi:alginate O-acetyltransferase complex protein AlgI
MLFSSLIFLLLFLPVFFLCYHAVKKRRGRNALLFVFSLLFYAWGEPVYVLLMLLSLGVNYGLALGIAGARETGREKKSRSFLILACCFNLLLIGVFKYAGFLVGSFNLLPAPDLPVPDLPLPIGISFYTFQILSYDIDVYRGDVKAQRDPVTLGAYLCAFPQLIAGPIVRYRDIEAELADRCETAEDTAEGMRRFIAGLAKKVLIANVMAQTADALFASDPEGYGAAGAWIAALAYTVQIYFDFSGYSDMAIGLGRMMGFRYAENFNYPYSARSVTDFWRRWHISLSSFFRDYVYIPLGGNRVSTLKWIRNIAVVWLLTGLWHGAGWNFVLWGAYYGLLLILEKKVWPKLEDVPVLNRICTLAAVVLGWVMFRSEGFGQMRAMFAALFGAYGFAGEGGRLPILLQGGHFDVGFLAAFAAGCVLSAPVWPALRGRISSSGAGRAVRDVSAILALAACILALAVGSYNPFIYFRF